MAESNFWNAEQGETTTHVCHNCGSKKSGLSIFGCLGESQAELIIDSENQVSRQDIHRLHGVDRDAILVHQCTSCSAIVLSGSEESGASVVRI